MQFMDKEMLMKAEDWCFFEGVRKNNTYLKLWYLAIMVYQSETHYALEAGVFASIITSSWKEDFNNEINRIRN